MNTCPSCKTPLMAGAVKCPCGWKAAKKKRGNPHKRFARRAAPPQKPGSDWRDLTVNAFLNKTVDKV